MIALLTSGSSGKKEKWVKLFNGKDLSGWVQRNGNAEYQVKNKQIIGISRPNTPNSFLCTEKEYGDFILELELKVDTALNSGIQIRSHSRTDQPNGRVYGYQIEIDPSKRGWSGGIYDEARTGWLYPVTPHNPAGSKAFKNNAWNHYRIEAIGNNIKTWVNGVPVADLLVDLDESGFIALQVHSINVKNKPWTDGTTVCWRNIRIMTENLEANRKKDTPSIKQINVIPNSLSEQEKSEGWMLLFDGKTTNGWRGAMKKDFPTRGWVVKDGILEVLPKNEGGGGGDIVTVEQFDNFDLMFDFKISKGANSGVKYYVTENGYGKGTLGLEYQVLDDKEHPDAKNGRDGNRTLASLYDMMTAKGKRFNGVNQWNTGRIIAKDNHVEHWLNGIKVLEYDRGSEAYRKMVQESKYKDMKDFGGAAKGHILIQDHNDRVWYRNIKIKKL
ncbi:MAG: DUF1080 domain-containing protein [Bacteroidales bacterium]|jgi:hypothetical protein|nr:DUF1080 domain-containing protein [Bacteroidales bacterium]